MSKVRFWSTLLVVPALAGVFTLAGCGDSKPTTGGGTKQPEKKAEGGTKQDSGSAASGDKTPVEGTGTGTLKGKVTFDGKPPERKDLAAISENQDKAHCLKGDTKDQLWIVGGDQGVANVVVWLKAPEGKYFKVPNEAQARTDKVTMDQPFCAFTPHIVAINPSFYDAASKKQKKTGQVFEVLNSAPVNHNTAWSGNKLFNSGKNEIIPGKKDKVGSMVVEAKPGRDSDAGAEDLISINCDIHKWMTAKVAVFDHPFYAVTDEKGNFEIKNVPAGAEVTLAYWHESMGDLKSAKKEPITLKAGDNTKDLKVK